VESTAARVAHNGGSLLYLADGVYSMGGRCPILELSQLAARYPIHLYIDDAHGISVFGKCGRGFAASAFGDRLPEHVTILFSLAKGFGCNGGGVCFGDCALADLVRTAGIAYRFSGPLDISITGAVKASLQLHRNGTVENLQAQLQQRIAQLDSLCAQGGRFLGSSPIRIIRIGDERKCVDASRAFRDSGFLATCAFHPVVPRGQSQIRLALAANHTSDEIRKAAAALQIAWPSLSEAYQQ
jgi:7-keto-8-aminopelargonate synthetase-like enzyme